MANNRLWLIHPPTGAGIMLGKHMGGEWYQPPNEDRFDRFYEHIFYEGGYEGKDDFVLFMEDASDSTTCNDTGWGCATGNSGEFMKFERKEKNK